MPVDRKPFLLRLDPQVLRALQRWAEDDLRSLNAQIEFLLRDQLVQTGRMNGPPSPTSTSSAAAPSSASRSDSSSPTKARRRE